MEKLHAVNSQIVGKIVEDEQKVVEDTDLASTLIYS